MFFTVSSVPLYTNVTFYKNLNSSGVKWHYDLWFLNLNSTFIYLAEKPRDGWNFTSEAFIVGR